MLKHRSPCTQVLYALGRSHFGHSSRVRKAGSPESSDVLYVNPYSKDIDTKQFFEFQTGRWLRNDKKERAVRNTKFSFEGLIDVLKTNLDYLEKTPEQNEFSISMIEPLFEGKHHKLYRIALKDLRQYVLRIPYAIGHAEYRKHRLLSEVATMDFFRKKYQMRIPAPIAWSGDCKNPIGREYILMDYVAGQKLISMWKPWSQELQEKSPIIQAAINFINPIIDTKFSRIGSLYFTEDVDASLRDKKPYNEKDPELADRWRIGPTTEKRFWKGSSAAIGQPFRGPFDTFEQYLRATADVQVAYAADAVARYPNNQEVFNGLKAAERYQKLVPSLFSETEMAAAPEIYAPRMNHPDASPLNILRQEEASTETTTGIKDWIIDFENCTVKPFVCHGVPWFVRNRGERIYKRNEVPNYDELPEMEKLVVDHYISSTQNEFTYEYLFHSLRPDLFQAFNPNIKRREEVVERALSIDIDSGFYNDLNFAIYKLGELWPYMSLDPQRPFPVPFTGPEIDMLSSSVQIWNAKVAKDPSLETKGYMPATQFEKMLGEGKIVPQEGAEGNYVLVE